MKKLALNVVVGMIMLGSVAVHAQVVVDPDAFPAGTVLNNAYPGVTLSAMGPAVPNDEVLALVSGSASTGSLVFGNNEPGNENSWGDGGWDYLRADFAAEAIWVELDFASNDAGGDNNAELIAYDSWGFEIDRDGPYFVPGGTFLTLTVNGPGIAYIEAYWDEITRSENGVLDNLVFLSFIEVAVDIKPGSYPNSITPDNSGVIPVAILTTADFDALTIDADSVLFGPDEAERSHRQAHVYDVDGDGDLDLLFHFRTQQTGIAAGDTEACVTGQTFDGVPITGCDSVQTVPPM